MAQDPFGEIPLFREIQKIISSGDGPLNLEIARQVSHALVPETPAPDAAAAKAWADAVHEAQEILAGLTRLAPEEPFRSDVVAPRAWATTTLESWRWLLDHLATRFAGEVTRFSSARGQEVDAMGAVMTQIAPLLLGIQAGTLVGHLAREALGRYDPPIPRDDDGKLFFVPATVDQISHDYGVEISSLRRWVALHDSSRHLLMTAHPWLARYGRSLFIELVDAIEIDLDQLESRLMDLQTKGAEVLEGGMGSAEMLPLVSSERHRSALSRVKAYAAALEGYATHAAGTVARELSADGDRIDEAMTRRSATASEGAAMLAGLLGVRFDRNLEAAGVTFCRAVTELRGVDALNQMWAAPDNLPTIDEIKDPFDWIDRIVDEGS